MGLLFSSPSASFICSYSSSMPVLMSTDSDRWGIFFNFSFLNTSLFIDVEYFLPVEMGDRKMMLRQKSMPHGTVTRPKRPPRRLKLCGLLTKFTFYRFNFLFWRPTDWAFVWNFFVRDITANLTNVIVLYFIFDHMINGTFI